MLQTEYSSWGGNYRQELIEFADYVSSLNNDNNDDNYDNDDIIDTTDVIDYLNNSNNDTVIFAIGPLTNIAHIIDSSTTTNIKKIVIMGGGLGLFNAPGHYQYHYHYHYYHL